MSFANKTPDEVRLLTFDFSTKAVAGVTLSNPTTTVAAVLSGTGVIGDLTLGTAGVVDLTVTTLASAGTDGTRYRLKAEATASNGETLEVERDLTVSASSAVVS